MKASLGIGATKNVKFKSGISASIGIESSIPPSFQCFYPFVFDFLDRVSGEYEAVFDNLPSFGGGGVNTVANTDLQVTTFQDNGKGVYLDEPDQPGSNPCIIGQFTSANAVNGVDPLANTFTFNEFGGGQTGKYFTFVNNLQIGCIVIAPDGNQVRVTATNGFALWTVQRLTTMTNQQLIDSFGFPNQLTVDFSASDYYPTETGLNSVAEVRTNAGDDVSGFPTSKQWDVSGDFRFGYIGIGSTVADVLSQVLLQTGNMGITTGIGITFAEIGASISSLSVTSDTIVGECFLKYVSGMLSIVIDGVESTPVASAAPAIGGFAKCGTNNDNTLPAAGTYGELIFEVL